MPMMLTPMTPNNYAQQTNHDYTGSFGRIPNEPKSVVAFIQGILVGHL